MTERQTETDRDRGREAWKDGQTDIQRQRGLKPSTINVISA